MAFVIDSNVPRVSESLCLVHPTRLKYIWVLSQEHFPVTYSSPSVSAFISLRVTGAQSEFTVSQETELSGGLTEAVASGPPSTTVSCDKAPIQIPYNLANTLPCLLFEII